MVCRLLGHLDCPRILASMGTIVTPSDGGRIDADSVRPVTQKAGEGGVKSTVAWLWCEFHWIRCPSQSCALCGTLPEGSPYTHAIRQTFIRQVSMNKKRIEKL